MRMLGLILLCACFSLKAQDRNYARKIDSLMLYLANNGQFSGAVIVAHHGKTIYEHGFGYADRVKHELFTIHTPCYIGSLSKQFTGVGIVQLKEKGLIVYDQPVRQYFPSLPAIYDPVTILDLLHHSSGLPLFNDVPGMTEQDVFRIIQQQTALRFKPGSKFEYCNANYTLLGMLIEKITGQTLDSYLRQSVFYPTGMVRTYADDPGIKNRKRATGYYLFGDEYNYSTYIGGGASVVSTAEDLRKWDMALYGHTVLSVQGLQDIFTPAANSWNSNAYGQQAYGFGWFISTGINGKIVQHDGGFAGFRSYIERQTDEKNTIIFISNVRHELIGEIREAINNILHDKPFGFPKISAANRIVEQAKTRGMEQAIEEYKKIAQTQDSSHYQFSERECNSLGYYLMDQNRHKDAILLFRLNTTLFPKSGNAFDSLGEGYLKTGDKKNALASYRRAAELDPSNKGAVDIVRKLVAEGL